MKYLVVPLLFLITLSVKADDMLSNGQWLTLGYPTKFHIGTNGALYISGSNIGACDNVKPTYFRVSMDAPHFDNFYSFVLFSAANKKPIDCMIKSGCGSSQVWVEYCRGDLN